MSCCFSMADFPCTPAVNLPTPVRTSRTPPPIDHAVEILPQSTLLTNILECLRLPRPCISKTRPSRGRGGSARLRDRKPRGLNVKKSARHAKPRETWHQTHSTPSNLPLSPIDTLAAVAEAENLSDIRRLAKRARSELLPSPQYQIHRFSSDASRPATSYLPPVDWNHALPATTNSSRKLWQVGLSYTDTEKLAAEQLICLSHAPTKPSTPRCSTDVFIGLESSCMQLQSKRTTCQCNAAAQTCTQVLNTTHASFGQTHTPPEEYNGLMQETRYSDSIGLGLVSTAGSSLGPDVEAGQVYDLPDALPLIRNDGDLHIQQLHSPQSSPAESDESLAPGNPTILPQVKKEVDREGLGIQVESCPTTIIAPPDPITAQDLGRTEPIDGELDSRSTKADAMLAVMQDVHTTKVDGETKCGRCGFFANSLTDDTVDWLQCNGCQDWFHFACTDFTNKEIMRIDKFFCLACKPTFGPPTFVRKSTRHRTNVDYSSLNQGFFTTIDEDHEHRYIKHFKSNDMKYVQPDKFPRLAPAGITLDYLQRLPAFDEPIVIPASLNPRPWATPQVIYHGDFDGEPGSLSVPDDEEADLVEQEIVEDVGQDRLGMVIPEGLTVRRVAEIHGPDQPLPVIDVKTQDGDSKKKWTLSKWADYYETRGDKAIRNVISLEVSYSPLGRLLRRPQIVRDLDLQDSVWPASDVTRKAVQYYVLMSVADCYTDFHIDFGGSSVFYHVLKGKKVFFFIPPTKQNLKKYEDWCVSPAQNETFLPDQTKECYRIDLEAGDTMLIPSGWIHSVWTPEDSLVIGGNFLTYMNISMQLIVNDIEENTGVEVKYRYPHFQKVQWYTIIKYLMHDPLPDSVEAELTNGQCFERQIPIWQEFDGSDRLLAGSRNYNQRYYSKTETEGWIPLLEFIHRTVLIHLGKLEGISQKSRSAVTRGIPKGHGDPLALAMRFACWVAWKRGNEFVPEWAQSKTMPSVEVPAQVSAQALAQAPVPATTQQTSERPNSLQAPFVFAELSEERQVGSVTDEACASHCLNLKVDCESCENKGDQKHIYTPTLTDNEASAAAIETAPLDWSDTTVTGSLADHEPTNRQSTSLESKRRWGKACFTCRRNKRRCIHDEAGNADKAKQRKKCAQLRNQPVPSGEDTAVGAIVSDSCLDLEDEAEDMDQSVEANESPVNLVFNMPVDEKPKSTSSSRKLSSAAQTSPEDEASMRVAMELQAEQFGLRSRRGAV